MTPVSIRREDTPNPNARRYVLDRPVQEQAKGRFFRAPDETDEPLVKRLFGVEGVVGVMLLPNSVTVNKAAQVTWEEVDHKAVEALETYFA